MGKTDFMDAPFDVVIVGAGMCGLSLAKALAGAGRSVAVIEARDRPGGRIHTLEQHFSESVDAGAEFVHGDLPLTKKLAKQSGSALKTKKGKLYKFVKGHSVRIREMIDDYKKVMSRLKSLEQDMPLSEFLDRSLNGPADKGSRTSVVRMAEGFDVAEPGRISSFAVRDEWQEGTLAEPSVPEKGYGSMVTHLYRECLELGCRVLLSSPVSAVSWKKERAEVRCGKSTTVIGRKVIVTVPLGILTAEEHDQGHIRFTPTLPAYIKAAKKIGYGAVVKVILEFKRPFWDHKDFKDSIPQMPGMAFFITDGVFPTWWAHLSGKAILTAWSGGPNAARLKNEPEAHILQEALAVLSSVFSIPAEVLGQLLIVHTVINWAGDPFSKGAYSYDTVDSDAARKQLLTPVEDTVYFCGEALAEGGVAGTVEAALASAAKLGKLLVSKSPD